MMIEVDEDGRWRVQVFRLGVRVPDLGLRCAGLWDADAYARDLLRVVPTPVTWEWRRLPLATTATITDLDDLEAPPWVLGVEPLWAALAAADELPWGAKVSVEELAALRHRASTLRPAPG